jgi:hypothetical protein
MEMAINSRGKGEDGDGNGDVMAEKQRRSSHGCRGVGTRVPKRCPAAK